MPVFLPNEFLDKFGEDFAHATIEFKDGGHSLWQGPLVSILHRHFELGAGQAGILSLRLDVLADPIPGQHVVELIDWYAGQQE